MDKNILYSKMPVKLQNIACSMGDVRFEKNVIGRHMMFILRIILIHWCLEEKNSDIFKTKD